MRKRTMMLSTLVAGMVLGTAGLSLAYAGHGVLGAPAAVVTQDYNHGAAAQGDALTPLPHLKPAPAGRVHHIRLDVTNKLVEIAPGKKLEAWTFGDSVPGPTVHIRQGDKVVFTMTNRSKEAANISPPLPHSIDFHAAQVNPMDKYRSIAPGESLSFEWTANYPGVFMYHCGTPMLLHHMCMGMYGAVVVDPANGWPNKVDREYVLVQSEFYTKPIDAKHPDLLTTDLEKAMAKQPDYVAFNGQAFQYQANPLPAKPGERVRLYVLNAGPSDTSSFHVVGTIMDTVYLDGNPANVLRGMQTVLLGSSGAAVVELTLPEAGEYPIVDHEFADASKGAIAVLNASNGQAAAPEAPAAAAAPAEHCHE